MKRRNAKKRIFACLAFLIFLLSTLEICAEEASAFGIENSEIADTEDIGGTEVVEVEEVSENRNDQGNESDVFSEDAGGTYGVSSDVPKATSSDYAEEPSYTLTVPSEVIFQKEGEESRNIDVILEKNSELSLTVTVSSCNGYDEVSGTYRLLYETSDSTLDSIPYWIYLYETSQTGDRFPVLSVSPEDSWNSITVPMRFVLSGSAVPRYAGNYHDTLTFTVECTE